ncbi:MAG: hypothetical protein N2572_07220 [Syntrophales bacterium]|nr:hypothetical protein [Syntrophales bacterium]
MNSVDYLGTKLGDIVRRLEEKGAITCLSHRNSLKKRLYHPQVTVYAPGECNRCGLVTISEREDGEVIALFLPEGETSVKWIDCTLFVSRVDIYHLSGKLKALVREFYDGIKMTHGNLMEVGGRGILITGPSGVGKTNCAWLLLKRGFRLVADDAVVLKRTRAGGLTGSAPEVIRGCLHLREKGIIRLHPDQLVEEVPVSVDVNLIKVGKEQIGETAICGVRIPQIKVKGKGSEEIVGKIEQLLT